MPTLVRYERGVDQALTQEPRARAPGPSGLATLGGAVAGAGGALAGAAASIGGAIEAERAAAAEKAKKEAEGLYLERLSEELDDHGRVLFEDPEKGFRFKLGDKAFATGEDAVVRDAYDRVADEKLGPITSPELREQAEKLVRAKKRAFRLGVERHVAEQFQADKVSTHQAREVRTLKRVASNYFDEEEVELALAQMDATTERLIPSAEAREVYRTDLRKKAMGIVLDEYLDKKDVQGAKSVLLREKETFGTDAEPYVARIRKVELTVKASEWVDQALELAAEKGTGWIHENTARGLLKSIEDDDLRAESEVVLEDALKKAAVRKRNDISQVVREAHTAYLKGGETITAIPPKTRDWLEENAPEEWQKFMRARKRVADARKTGGGRKGDGEAAARREQANLNRLAMLDFMQKTTEERADLDVAAAYGLSGADQIGLGEILVKQREAKEAVARGAATDENFFVETAYARARDTLTSKAQQDKFKAEATSTWNDFWKVNKRKPSAEEASKMIETLIVKTIEERTLNPFGDEPFGFDSETTGWKSRAAERKAGKQPQVLEPTASERAKAAAPDAPKPFRPKGKPRVVETRRAPDGRLVQKLSDGTHVWVTE